MQKLTDEYMKKIDSIYKQKEKVTSFWLNWGVIQNSLVY